jgi:hypothetical protein
MHKSILIALSLISMPALACSVQNIQTWLKQITPAAIADYCRDHGNQVSSIEAGSGIGQLSSDPSVSIGNFAVKCVDGSLQLANVTLDSSSCMVKSVITEPTVRIWP